MPLAYFLNSVTAAITPTTAEAAIAACAVFDTHGMFWCIAWSQYCAESTRIDVTQVDHLHEQEVRTICRMPPSAKVSKGDAIEKGSVCE